MGAEENLQVVRTYFATELRGAQQVAEETRLFTKRARSGVVVLVDGAPGIALAPRGRLRAVLRIRVDEDNLIHAIDIIADDEHVVVPLHLRGITGRGEPYENDYVFIFRIRDGRIAEVWENLDTLYLHTKLHT